MKKLLILAALLVAGVAANAASFKWTAANIYGSDGVTKFSGTASLYAEGIDGVIYAATVTSGAINATAGTFETTKTTVGQDYNFYFVIEDGGKTFTSATVTAPTQATSTQAIGFGNMASQTQNSSNWSGSAVPEPTSGLLMLLGMAGLALRRRHA